MTNGPTISNPDKQDYVWKGEIFKKIIDIAYPYIQEKNDKATFNEIISILEEAYAYVIKNNKGKVDDKIVKWIIDKNLDYRLL